MTISNFIKEVKFMKVINIKKNPEFASAAIEYLAKNWNNKIIYQDCINNSLNAANPLPQWYLLMDGDDIIGCAGLITNDFISRMDLWPWLCALYIEEAYRGQNLASLLIEELKKDTKEFGFDSLYLATNHIGFYEKHGFTYTAEGYHPWGDVSRIYEYKV